MTLPLSYSRPPIQEAHYLYFSKPAQHKCGGGRIRTCVDPKVDGFTARCHWPLDHPSIRGRLGTGTGGRFLISLSFSWREESNPQPTDYKSVALPLSYASILLILNSLEFSIRIHFSRCNENVRNIIPQFLNRCYLVIGNQMCVTLNHL